jgi:hypothetical protein
VLNKGDALLTLTEVSLPADEAVSSLSGSVLSISIIYRLVGEITDLARFVHIRFSR